MPHAKLITPYGSKLVNLIAPPQKQFELLNQAYQMPSIQLSFRALCDLELLATGAFSPLRQFMGKADYRRVINEMHLQNGLLFPIPITLPTNNKDLLHLDTKIALRDHHNEVLGVMLIEEIYTWNLQEEANLVFGTDDSYHPLVAEMNSWGKYYLAGPLQIIRLPPHFDFPDLYLTPQEVRQKLQQLGFKNIVAFQTRNPMHRAHEELTKQAARLIEGVLLLHPSVGSTKPDDVDYFTRVRSYLALWQKYYQPENSLLSLLPLAMRLAGPREAVWHAIIRRNYGANHFIVGRDHASPGNNSLNKPFYPPYKAQELAKKAEEEIGVKILGFREMVYVPAEKKFYQLDRVPKHKKYLSLSGTTVRNKYLTDGRRLPSWFTRPEVAKILALSYPPRQNQGFCIWFTGLPKAGKSTLAEILALKLRAGGKQVTLLDGDVVRAHLTGELGFSKNDRDLNVLRIGFVASEIVRHRGIAICAAISPYRSTRDQVRHLFSKNTFIEIYLSTPLSVCKKRDTKGLYRLAEQGKIKHFTGIDDPYEPPLLAEIKINTQNYSPKVCVNKILRYLASQKYLPSYAQIENKI